MEENKDNDCKLLILPKEKLPECWGDEMRMSSLCAPIRAKTVNPLDYESKMKFWSSMIHLWCNYFTIPSFTLEDLNHVFKRNGITPLCLPLVIDEMVKMGDLSTQTDFLEPPPSESWTVWSLDIFVRKPIVWTFNKMKDTLFGSTPTSQSNCIFVYIAVVEKQAKKILESIKEEDKNKILTLDNLKEISGQEKINLALYLLHKKRKVTLQNTPDNKAVFVKFNSQNKTFITPIDLGIFTLKNNEKTLIKNIEDLESEKEKLNNEAKTFLAKGSRQLAKSSLRKKKEIERCIEKRAIALENVQTLLARIRDAETDAKIVEAYEYGLDALRQTFKEAGLNEENVANTMDNVKEAIAIGNDVSQDIAQPILEEGTDADFEAELEMLMTDVEEISTTEPNDEDTDSLTKRLKNLRMDLPSPPKDIPSLYERKRDTSKIKVQL